MTSSGEANPGGDLPPPPFREPRLPSIFGKRRSDDSQRLAAEMAEKPGLGQAETEMGKSPVLVRSV